MGERSEYGSGSIYKKQTYILNRKTGEKIPHEYWQAARVVRLEELDSRLTEAKDFDFGQGGGGPAIVEIYKNQLFEIQDNLRTIRELC